MLRRVVALFVLLAAGVVWTDHAHADEPLIEKPDGAVPETATAELALPHPFHETHLYWDRGPTLEALNGSIRFHLGGRIQLDTVWYSGPGQAVVDAAGGQEWRSASEIRRAQLFLEGWVGDHWYFKARFDTQEGDGAWLQDLYADWRGPHDRSNGRIPVSYTHLTLPTKIV